MTEREKIANILNSTEISQELSKDDIYKFADALITAGYGDMSKQSQRYSEKIKRLKATIVRNEQKAHEVIYRRTKCANAAEHRAEVAEKALDKACADMGQLMDCCRWAANGGVITIEEYTPEKATPRAYKKRAEKELAEGKKE